MNHPRTPNEPFGRTFLTKSRVTRLGVQEVAISEIGQVMRDLQRLSDSLRAAKVLLPKEAARLIRMPLADLEHNFKPVLIRSWKSGGVTKRRLGYRLSDLEAHIERRVLQ